MHSVYYKRITLWLLLLFKTGLIFSQITKVPKPKIPDEIFSFSAPEEKGFSSKGLCDIFNYVKENKINIHSLLIVRNKKIVPDAYFYPFRSDLRHDIASCTKSITSILIGIAIDKGYIKSEDQLVSTFFPEIKRTGTGYAIKD